MSAPPALPSVPGIAWSRHKTPKFSTRIASHVSGREVRAAYQQYPLYEFEAAYTGLSSSSLYAGLGTQSLQALMGFFLQMQGQFGTFLYTDPDDNSVTGGGFGTGDGATQAFVLSRSLGGFVEPVSWVTNVSNVYVNGVAQPASDWLFTAPNMIGFATAPASGMALTADFTFAFQCRFLDDQMDFDEFMSALWKLDSMKFRSVKANTSTTNAVIPTWYTPYAIGGTSPTKFADWRTEGTTNHYFYNNATYGSFAALLSAIGGTFSRSSTKYIVNSSGNLASIAANALPFDYSPTSIGTLNGLLLEGASTNLLYPSTFGGSAYGATLTPGAALGPDGIANSASSLVNGSGTNYFTPYLIVSYPVTGVIYTHSIYAKAGTAGSWLMIGSSGSAAQGAYFNLTTGTLGNVGAGSTATITQLANGWYRCSVSYVVNNGSYALAIVICSSNGEGNYGLATFTSASENATVYGTQVEQLGFASSYIPTTSGTAGRAADSLYVPWTATTFTARVKATLSGQVNGNVLMDAGGGLLSQAAGPDAQTSNGSQTLTSGVNAYTSQNIIVVGGSSSGRVLSANGNTAAADAHALVPSAPTDVQIGANTSDGNNANGDYAQFGLWTVAATAAQAAANSGTG